MKTGRTVSEQSAGINIKVGALSPTSMYRRIINPEIKTKIRNKNQDERKEDEHMSKGRYGIHGGQYISETLMNELIHLEECV